MAIPVNPALIAGATNFTATSPQAVPMNLCKLPQEGLKCVPLAISPQKDSQGQLRGSVLVNLQFGATPPISQVCSIYVDATQSSSDITIFFPDTGYEFKAFSGNSQLIPVLTGTILPQFYVIFGNNQSFLASDMANIFLLNQFVPEFGGGNVIKTQPLNFGVTQGGATAPFFSQSNCYTSFARVGIGSPPKSAGIPGRQCFLTGININYYVSAATVASTIEVQLFDDDTLTNKMMQFDAFLDVSSDIVSRWSDTFVDLSGLNIISSFTDHASSNHFIGVISASTGISAGLVNFNLVGGTLIT